MICRPKGPPVVPRNLGDQQLEGQTIVNLDRDGLAILTFGGVRQTAEILRFGGDAAHANDKHAAEGLRIMRRLPD